MERWTYLHVSLLEQRLVAVGRWVGDDHAVVFTLGSETLIQQNAEEDRE